MVILLAFGAVIAVLVGAGIAIGYGLGRSHGAAEVRSVALEHRYKRCTPEPTRLRLVDYRHPVFFDQDGDTA